jgi:hypothetical protein
MKPTGTGAAAKRKSQKTQAVTARKEQLKPAKEELLAPTHEEARELCLLAQQIGIAEPWQWMEEIELFGVQDPLTGEVGFVSLLGRRGEYRAVAVYLGEEALRGWFDFNSALILHPELPDAARLLLEIPHLHVSFSDSGGLEKRDRDLLKGLGLKFTGLRPLFRSSRPGYWPWFITREEARLMVHILSQTINVAGRLLENPNIFFLERDDTTISLLVRVPHSRGSELIWEDRIQKIPLRKPELIASAIEPAALKKLKQITQVDLEIELDLFMGPGAVGKRSERPLAVFNLLLGDHQSGFICGVKTMTAEHGLGAMYSGLPNQVAHLLLEMQLVSKRLRIRSEKLLTLMAPLASELNIELLHVDELPAIEEAANFLFEQMGS